MPGRRVFLLDFAPGCDLWPGHPGHPSPSPGTRTPGVNGRWDVLLRLFGHLEPIYFSIVFSMPLRNDLGSIFPPNLPPKIYQNPLKFDAKMPSHLDSIF